MMNVSSERQSTTREDHPLFKHKLPNEVLSAGKIILLWDLFPNFSRQYLSHWPTKWCTKVNYQQPWSEFSLNKLHPCQHLGIYLVKKMYISYLIINYCKLYLISQPHLINIDFTVLQSKPSSSRTWIIFLLTQQ
jgi:hypothetical protein